MGWKQMPRAMLKDLLSHAFASNFTHIKCAFESPTAPVQTIKKSFL